jgi:hypothetical protein
MARERLDGRLLSHRLRGFDTVDGTRRGLDRALVAGVRHVEFDVRFTRDYHPVIYHDPFFFADDNSRRNVDAWDLAKLRAEDSMRQLATLDELCACMADHGRRDVLMHVDLKVAGREELIRDTIMRYGLLDQTVLVSWLPSALVRFNAISPNTRLCFSHLTLARAPWLFPMIEWLYPIGSRLVAPLLHRFSRPVFRIDPERLHTLLATRPCFDDDGDPVGGQSVNTTDARFVRGHIVPRLLSGKMLDLLRRTRGLVCVPIPLATRSLKQDYHADGIELAVYSVKDSQALDSVVRRVDPDIIYVDNAELFAPSIAESAA